MNCPACRSRDITANPSMPGSMTSSTTTSKRGRVRFQCFQRGLAGLRHFHLVAFGLQVEAQAVGQVLLVFHYQDPAHLVDRQLQNEGASPPRPFAFGPGTAAVPLGNGADDEQAEASAL